MHVDVGDKSFCDSNVVRGFLEACVRVTCVCEHVSARVVRICQEHSPQADEHDWDTCMIQLTLFVTVQFINTIPFEYFEPCVVYYSFSIRVEKCKHTPICGT